MENVQIDFSGMKKIDEAPSIDFSDMKRRSEFDPEGDGYDYDTAKAAGLGPDIDGNWPSRNPKTGQILKGKQHETYYLVEDQEKKFGYKIKKIDGKYYSLPKQEPPLFDIDDALSAYAGILPEDVDYRQEFAELMYPVVRPFLAQGFEAAAALNRGLGVFSANLDAMAKMVADMTGLESGGIFEEAAKIYNGNTEYWMRKAKEHGPGFLDELLGEAVGGMVPGVAEFILNVPYSALTGAARAQQEGKNPVVGALVEGGKRGLLGAIFHAIGPLRTWLKAPVMGTVMATESAAAGQPVREIAKSFGIGALYGATSPGGNMGLNEVYRSVIGEARYQQKKQAQLKKAADWYRENVIDPNKRAARETDKILKDIEKELGPEKVGPVTDPYALKEGRKVAEETSRRVMDAEAAPQMSKAEQAAVSGTTTLQPTAPPTGINSPAAVARRQKKVAKRAAQAAIQSAKDVVGVARKLIRTRRFWLNVKSYETNLFTNEIDRTLTKQEREVVPFLIEGTGIPRALGRADLEKIYNDPTQRAKVQQVADQVKQHFEQTWQVMKAMMPEMPESGIQNYVTHIWDISPNQRQAVTNWFITQNRFLKKRFIETYKEGIEVLGLKPKNLDISELIRTHDGVMYRVLANRKFVEDLFKLKKNGVNLIERGDLAPAHWKMYPHPALKKYVFIPGETKMGEKVSRELQDILLQMGVKIGARINPKIFGRRNPVQGSYNPKEQSIRLQRFFKERTLAHEIGHHIDKVLKLGDTFLNKYKDELLAVNRVRIAAFTGTKNEAYAKSSAEQIAELFALIFTKPDVAVKVAPTATADVLGRMRQDGVLTKLVDLNFEKNAKNLIEEQINTLMAMGVKVHPDLVKPMDVIFKELPTSQVGEWYDLINGMVKKAQLSFSLFHHIALFETGVATMGAWKTVQVGLNLPKIWKALRNNEFDIFKKQAIAKDGISHGLQVGATQDINFSRIQDALNKMAESARGIPVAQQTAAFIRSFNENWDKALWTYYHDSLKLYAYEHLAAKIDRTKGSAHLKSQKEEVAQFVNDTFGGQNWDTLMVNPATVRTMTRILLSPDWTVSTVRQALSITGVGAVGKDGVAMRRKMGAMFWTKAILYFGVGMNLLNVAIRKWDEKENPQYYEGQERGLEDNTMVGNAIGRKTYLFIGRYEDGTERYLRWGKQFRELPELFYDEYGINVPQAAFKKIGSKGSPLLQIVSQIFTGRSLSGFENPNTKDMNGLGFLVGFAKTIAEQPLPFGFRTALTPEKEFMWTDLAMPSSKGTTRHRAIELFMRGLKNNDDRMLIETYINAMQNNLPAHTLWEEGMAKFKAEETYEYNKDVKTLEDAIAALEKADNSTEIERLSRRINRLTKELTDKSMGLARLEEAMLDYKLFRLERDEEDDE